MGSPLFDVAVIGAGPAGSATARWLARSGWRVALLERTRFDAPRVGESLAPAIQESLRALGVWHEFLALDPLPSWSTCSVWGDRTPQLHSHVVNPYGCGWHIDRQAFDRMLAHAAKAAGVAVLEGATVERCDYADHWHVDAVEIDGAGRRVPFAIDSRALIDATGRRAQVGRALGANRILLDRLVGVAVQWSGVDIDRKGHLLVETAPEGWWYSAPLPTRAMPSDRMIAMVMTDADLCARFQLSNEERWQSALAKTDVMCQRLRSAHRRSAPQVYSAVSQRLQRDAAVDPRPWLAVGDAALAVDPISGSGVQRALRTARAAADAVDDLLRGPSTWRTTLGAYERERDLECTKYLIERAQYYAAEQRYHTAFWTRRQVLNALREMVGVS